MGEAEGADQSLTRDGRVHSLDPNPDPSGQGLLPKEGKCELRFDEGREPAKCLCGPSKMRESVAPLKIKVGRLVGAKTEWRRSRKLWTLSGASMGYSS